MSRVVSRRRAVVLAVGPDGVVRREREQALAAEEPLEIRAAGRSHSVTMRTPGEDFDLVAGFLLSEGVLRAREDLLALRYCVGTDAEGRQTYNVVEASLAPDAAVRALGRERRTYTTSACGVCGLTAIDDVEVSSAFDVGGDGVVLDPRVLAGLPEALRAAQPVFERTGGVHAAGLFTAVGDAVLVREDVGRHNAVDKVLGRALLDGRLPARGTVLQVSGRASFELVQKAVMAGVPALAAVGAPSGLAVELAERAGLTLVGFSRGDRLTVYTRPDRIDA
ncbi:formate dehydrogenase accessory sulfurtransferase FdhD [Cellulomonas endophytica]|uniref:formate dehydrogenase accessory sulfurtransferase FdhD n=1 Tax=Cellulomonas endophytica TaxID=2494735 RepID=UPI0010112790|nr:formate dehydrogenase accessory sulfurtransferase FdhD [Cellulomonas endophytica]